MAESEISKAIKEKINNKIKSNNEQKEFFKERIIVIDNEKVPLDSAIKSIDRVVFDQVVDVNDKLNIVKQSYANRISAGCRSNLFWRRTGISTDDDGFGGFFFVTAYRCTKTSPNGYSPIGISTTSIRYISDTSGGTTNVSGLKSLIALEAKNLYGIRYYDEPYDEDVVDSLVAGFIGTVGTASSTVTALVEYNGGSGSLGIVTTGQLLVSEKNGVFNVSNNEIVGIGTTIADLSVINSGLSTEAVVYTFNVESNAVVSASAPEEDGSFVEFQVLKSADQVGNLSITFGKNPYSPQTISMMKNSSIGKGVKAEFTNQGWPSASQTWKPELEGANLGSGVITKPQVSAGKIYYDVGFTVKPQKLVSGSWVDASEGDVGYIYSSILSDTVRVTNLGSCSAEETALTNAISIADAAEAEIASGTSTINQRLQISTALRQERNNLNIQIWGNRQLLGKLDEENSTSNSLKSSLNDDSILGIIT